MYHLTVALEKFYIFLNKFTIIIILIRHNTYHLENL